MPKNGGLGEKEVTGSLKGVPSASLPLPSPLPPCEAQPHAEHLGPEPGGGLGQRRAALEDGATAETENSLATLPPPLSLLVPMETDLRSQNRAKTAQCQSPCNLFPWELKEGMEVGQLDRLQSPTPISRRCSRGLARQFRGL